MHSSRGPKDANGVELNPVIHRVKPVRPLSIGGRVLEAERELEFRYWYGERGARGDTQPSSSQIEILDDGPGFAGAIQSVVPAKDFEVVDRIP